MYMLMFLLFKKNMCSQHILLSLLRPRIFLFFLKCYNETQTEQKTNVKWRLTCVSTVIETVCSVFMSVSVIHCNVCAYVVFQLPFSMVTMLEHYEICLWFQGLWKHVSVIANVISIAYCLVVLSISLITAFFFLTAKMSSSSINHQWSKFKGKNCKELKQSHSIFCLKCW